MQTSRLSCDLARAGWCWMLGLACQPEFWGLTSPLKLHAGPLLHRWRTANGSYATRFGWMAAWMVQRTEEPEQHTLVRLNHPSL